MATVPVYNSEGTQIETLELLDTVFAVPPKQSLVHQVFLALEANRRQPWADTKDRGEVRGGGRKPWKQKGTGRARHGSRRSPIWAGGGITFGPLSIRNYTQKINAKMKKAAVRACLSSKVAEQKFLVLDTLPTDGKTKTMAQMRTLLPGFQKTSLLVIQETEDGAALAIRNIQKFDAQRTMDLNVADIMTHEYLVLSRDAVHALEERLK